MRFTADFHTHSYLSRACSKQCLFPYYWVYGQIKGLKVIGTGDFTHPEWFARIKDELEPAEPGLFKLKESLQKEVWDQVPDSCRGQVRFVLTSEISNIYKKGDRTRKVHNLLFAPTLEAVENINTKLDAIGNIKSDGRPILGLDSKHLLEIALEAGDDTFLVPAHIWTPWFSVLGSKSGFDSIDECYEDLTEHIFALETGLSSDPPMNWRLSILDKFTLISNSDSHSPAKLGREANLFDCELDYYSIRDAMKTREGFLGTVEFFPEEGKYHLDGHRKCQTRLTPKESLKLNHLCPVCGKKVTVGVLSRVEELADREEDTGHGQPPFHSIVPLPEVLSGVVGVGPASKKVAALHEKVVSQVGSEFQILMNATEEEIASAGGPLVAEAVRRVRTGELHIAGGYDGEFGTIKIFTPEERERLAGQMGMISIPAKTKKAKPAPLFEQMIDPLPEIPAEVPSFSEEEEIPDGNPEQDEAIAHTTGPLLIEAGPGTGKTYTLVRRIENLVKSHNVDPKNILAVTFTNKAAKEMSERIENAIDEKTGSPFVTTFHSLCLWLLKNEPSLSPFDNFTLIDDAQRLSLLVKATDVSRNDGKKLLERISFLKQGVQTPNSIQDLDLESAWSAYEEACQDRRCLDMDDLIRCTVNGFRRFPEILETYQQRWKYILVDEYQDVNSAQYHLLRQLAPFDANLCVIGDPNQAIYGFRGADHSYFLRFSKDYPGAKKVRLLRNYRSTGTILDASFDMVQPFGDNENIQSWTSNDLGEQIHIIRAATEKSEAEFIAHEIEKIVGGVSMFSMDSGRTDAASEDGKIDFSQIAVLYRITALAIPVEKALSRLGIPYQKSGAKPFFQHPEIQEAMAYLRAVAFENAEWDLERALITGDSSVGEETLDAFNTYRTTKGLTFMEGLRLVHRATEIETARQRSLIRFYKKVMGLKLLQPPIKTGELVERVIKEFNLYPDNGETIENGKGKHISKLLQKAKDFDGSLAEFCEHATLAKVEDELDPRAEKVNLMSLHGAKGLEFPVVFIIGCEEDLIPYRKNKGIQSNISEERRLFFVGMTRAKSKLYLLHSKSRFMFGNRAHPRPSPFLKDIEINLTRALTAGGKTTSKKPKDPQLNLF